MGKDTYYELTRRSIPLTKNDGMYLSWRDSVIHARTDKGLHFFEFSYNLRCMDKDIDIIEYSIPCPKNSPAEQLCQSKFINSEMNNYDYTEMIVDPSFWPHNNSLAQDMTNVSMSIWSPRYFCENKSALAILNVIGGVEIFFQKQHEWVSMLNMCPYIQDSVDHNKTPRNFEELSESVYKVETSSICWAPELDSDGSCCLVTAQKSGDILFWQIFGDNRAPVLKGTVPGDGDLMEIKNILWIPRKQDVFWLVCADTVGQVIAMVIQIENGTYNGYVSRTLWRHTDRMIASHINYTNIDDKLVIFFSKHRHFIALGVDGDGTVLTQHVNNISDYRITAITNSVDGYYLGIINVKIFKLDIAYAEARLVINLTPVDLKDSFNSCELYSISFSNTNTLCALGIIDRRLLCRKEVFKIDVVILSTEEKMEALVPLILNNPTKKLTNYWDCIETLRYKIFKMKKMPPLDYNSMLDEGSSDVYKLKLYLFLLIYYMNMRSIARIEEAELPELCIDTVKEKILLVHAQSTMDTLYNNYKKNGKLSSLEEQTLCGCNQYIRYYSKRHKTDVIIDENIQSIVKSNFEYDCQSCDEKITDGFTCSAGHLNMYCVLSFTPITSDDYLYCKCCNATARTDLCVKDNLCVFCDLFLVKSD